MQLKYMLCVFIVVFILTVLIACSGPRGDQGFPGVSGIPGEAGPQGAPGIDLDAVSIVPLCPGVSNYSTFIEVGFCINNNLYATYSTHGGFSTLLAPGAYSSNAVGSSCNFVVVSGCEIQ